MGQSESNLNVNNKNGLVNSLPITKLPSNVQYLFHRKISVSDDNYDEEEDEFPIDPQFIGIPCFEEESPFTSEYRNIATIGRSVSNCSRSILISARF